MTLESDSSKKTRVDPDFSAMPFCTSCRQVSVCKAVGEVIGGWLRKCVSSCLFVLLAFRFQFRLTYFTYLDSRVVSVKEKVSDKQNFP